MQRAAVAAELTRGRRICSCARVQGMGTDKKFTFSKTAMSGLVRERLWNFCCLHCRQLVPRLTAGLHVHGAQDFESETVDAGSLETTGSFKLTDPTGMDVTYKYTKTDSGPGYSFKSTFKLDKLAQIPDTKVTLEGDNKNSVNGSVEYKGPAAAVTLGGGKYKGSTQFPFSVGLAPVTGVAVGISGTVKPDFKKEQLYENATVGYHQKGVFSACLLLTKNLSKVEARAIYKGLDSARVGLKVADALGSRSATLGGEYTVDSDTKVKAVVADNGSNLKGGVEKTLGPGCKLTVGYAVGVADIATVSKHKCGFVLEVE